MTAATDPSAPATKQDIGMMMETLGQILLKLTEHDQKFDEIDERFEHVEQKIDDNHRGMLVLLEQQRADLNDMYNDKLSQHDDRIGRIEKHLQLAA
jgi:hypothetical protein